jgi:outer membrane lipoprotein-sorting protein
VEFLTITDQEEEKAIYKVFIDENNIAITVDTDDGKAVVKSNGKQVWIYLDSGSKDYEVTTDYDKVKKPFF